MKGTKYRRLLFQLQPKTHRIEEIESGLLLKTFLLTPSASDGLRSGMTMDSLKRHNKANAENSNLAEQIAHKVGGGTSHLNPRFVAERMGFPPNWTELPFLIGEQKVLKDTETP
jgi:hypothetical protein